MTSFNLDTSEAWTAIYYIIGIATTIIGLLGFRLIEESSGLKRTKETIGEIITYSFLPKTFSENKRLYARLLAFAIFGISIQIFMPYLILYYEKGLGLANYVLIMAPAIIVATAFAFLYGRVYDKYGYQKAAIPCLVMLLLGYILLYLFKGIPAVFAGSLLMMSGYLSGMAIYGAAIRTDIPEGLSGRFQGIRIIGQVFIPGLIGPAIGARVLRDAEKIINSDGTYSFLPNEKIFLAAAVPVILLIIQGIVNIAAKKNMNGGKA